MPRFRFSFSGRFESYHYVSVVTVVVTVDDDSSKTDYKSMSMQFTCNDMSYTVVTLKNAYTRLYMLIFS